MADIIIRLMFILVKVTKRICIVLLLVLEFNQGYIIWGIFLTIITIADSFIEIAKTSIINEN